MVMAILLISKFLGGGNRNCFLRLASKHLAHKLRGYFKFLKGFCQSDVGLFVSILFPLHLGFPCHKDE